MKIVKKIKDLRSHISGMEGNTGFVPTMGYLHDGHSDLIRTSIRDNDNTIVSIFVNPEQFCEGEDLDRYPMDMERDIDILNTLGVNVLFLPDKMEIYPSGYKTFVTVREMDEVLCGRSRPGHFTGVATIVLKLINIIEPHYVYFGKKDAQQLIILKQMISDLNISSEVKSVDIRRDLDGLALSSRNSYLSEKGRKSALVISESLKYAEYLINEKRITDAGIIKKNIADLILKIGDVEIDYIEIVSLRNLEDLDKINLNSTLIAIAAYIEGVRLIDNIIFGEI